MIPNHGGFVWHSAQQKLTLTGGHVIFWVMEGYQRLRLCCLNLYGKEVSGRIGGDNSYPVMEGYYNNTAASTMPSKINTMPTVLSRVFFSCLQFLFAPHLQGGRKVNTATARNLIKAHLGSQVTPPRSVLTILRVTTIYLLVDITTYIRLQSLPTVTYLPFIRARI